VWKKKKKASLYLLLPSSGKKERKDVLAEISLWEGWRDEAGE